MEVAIIFRFLTSSLAGSVFSLRTAVSTTIVLILIAIVFERLLGLNLRLL